jgi:copper transport protein
MGKGLARRMPGGSGEARTRAWHGLPAALALAAMALALLGLLGPAAVAAHAVLDRAEPVARSAVPVAPTEIRLFFTEPPELRYSEISVYDANLRRFERGDLRPLPGDPLGLAIDVADLADGGIYTVAWKVVSTVDGHTTNGAFAFAVGNVPPPATVGLADEAEYTPPGPAEVVAKWLAILAATALVGALGLRTLVWRPILRDSGLPADGDFARRLSRRLARLAGGALLLLLVATAAAVALQAAKVGGEGLGGLDAALLSDFLLRTRAGAIWLTRLLIPVVALMLLAPLLIAAFRRDDARPAADDEDDAAPPRPANAGAPPSGPLAFGIALGLAYLLTISLISHSAAVGFWVPFNVGMDWLHLIAMALWVGGILGLVLTAPLVGDLGVAARPVLGHLVARFSTIGLASVAILGVTGLYSSWLHVGSLDALFGTDYGRALTGKLVLFAFLVALGALNRFWIGPRLVAEPAASKRRAKTDEGQGSRVSQLLLRYFGRIVRAEALLGIAIIAIVAVFTGLIPAREALIQSRLPKRYQTVTASDLTLTLTLGALQPGDNTFDLYLESGGRPVTNAERVALRLTHADMDMGEAEAIAESRGDGHYVASGPYLSMSGNWDVRAIVRRATVPDVDTTVRFPIGSTANLQAQDAKLTAPDLPRLNSPRGVGLLSLAAGMILAVFGVRLFRRGSGWGTAMLMLVPTAIVVGGYLVYNGQGNEPLVGAPVEPPNPIAADAASIDNGGRIFAQNCVVCHGPQGRGDGPQAGTLNPRPPNMTQPHTAYHSDGYMFNAITNGFPGSAMPAWGDTFTEREKWDLVNYLRQFNPLTASGATPPAFGQLPTPGVAGAATATAGTPATIPARGTPGAVGGSTPVATGVPVGAGRLIHAFDGNIWAFDPGTGQGRRMIADLPDDAYAGDPALSPDGNTLAFTVVVVPAPNPSAPPSQRVLPGSDIWLMDADGGNRRLLLTHDRPGVLIEMPYWTPDGKAIVYTYSASILNSDGRYTGSIRELQRLDVATGQRTALVKDGEDAAYSYAGGATPFAYVLTDPTTLQQSLWVADLDGGNARRIIGPDQKFQTVNSPRFTPDGTRLVFAASAPLTAGSQPPPEERSAPVRFVRWLFEPFIPQGVAAHGPPGDLWSIAIDGSDIRRLTNLNGDDPQPAFSPDGKQLAFLSGEGLFLANLDGGNARRISDRGQWSTLVWAPR